MTIYAKSRIGSRQPTLKEHTLDVLEAADALFGNQEAPSRTTREWLRFFKLPEEMLPSFFLNLRLAICFHDIGKANDGFQSIVTDRKKEQMVRHEHLSSFLMISSPLAEWIKSRVDADFEVILSAVGCHHLQYRHEDVGRWLSAFTHFNVLDFSETLETSAEIIGITPPNIGTLTGRWDESKLPVEAIQKIGGRFNRSARPSTLLLGMESNITDTRYRLLLAVRSALITADAAGSGLVRQGKTVGSWIREAFNEEGLLNGEWIDKNIVFPRIEQIRSQRRDFSWNDFQDKAEGLDSRVLLLAACGAGKTLAAWRWIRGQLSRKKRARAIFLYPTRGTATEGFKDYVSWAPESDAALLHGTSSYELDGMFEGEDARSGRDFTTDPRLFALGQWNKRVFSATVDSFFGVMANQYGPMCLLPLLSDCVLVVDEVHSFSPGMFSSLIKFLEKFDVPVLCMTASLPPARKKRLTDIGMELFPSDPEQFKDLERIAGHPRYRVCGPKPGDVEAIVDTALMQGKRVLWVVNRVDECQRIASAASRRHPDVRVLCYHSRFKLDDRNRRHREVIALFKEMTDNRLALVVTTQVCEMSLDLDADVLVSEAAPVPSLVQRMGRCCRVPNPGDRRGEVFIYEPGSHMPYDKDEIGAGLLFQKYLIEKKEASQQDLSAYLDTLQSRAETERYEAFWECGFFASSHDNHFREGLDLNVDCVLDSDLDEYLNAQKHNLPSKPGFVLPVPKGEKPGTDDRLKWLRVARAENYDVALGYMKGR